MGQVVADGGDRAETELPALESGYDHLFRSTYARLVVALTLAADRAAAEDAVQDAFVQALRHWSRVSTYDDPAAWVRRAALNRLANQRRSGRRRDRAVDSLRTTTPFETRDADHAALCDLRAALADLPVRERAAVVLHHVVGVPLATIAEDLDLPIGTVKSIVSRSRNRLREALGDPAEPDEHPGGVRVRPR